MTAVARDHLDTSEPPAGGADPESAPRGAYIAIGVFVVLQLSVPAKLVVAPLGQIGNPATLWGLLCLLWYFSALLWKGSGIHRGRRQPLRWGFGLLLVVWLISYALLPSRFPLDFERNAADAEILMMLSLTGIGLLAADGLETRTQVVKLCRFICVFWSVVCVVALLQFRGYDPMGWIQHIPGMKLAGGVAQTQARGSFDRTSGTTSHPIEFATITAMVLPMALQLQRYARRPRWWGVVVVLVALGVATSLSRSGFVGAAIGLLTIGLGWTWKERRRAAVYGLAIAAVMFMAVPGFLGTVTRMFTGFSSDDSITTRTDDYAAVQPLIVERPWFGRGIATFSPPQYRILDNQYLLTLIEAGAVGVIALVVFLTISALTAREAWCHLPDGASRSVARGVMAAILVGAASLAFFDGFSFEAFTGMLALFCGLGGALWRLSKDDPYAEDDAVPSVVAAT